MPVIRDKLTIFWACSARFRAKITEQRLLLMLDVWKLNITSI